MLEERVFTAVCVACGVVLLGLLLTFSYGRDQGIYALVARSILEGGMPYRDAWDFKPPGIFLIYAAARALFGSHQVGIRILEAAGIVAMTGAMMRLTGEWWGHRRIGLLAGVITLLVNVEMDFWHTSQPESFGGMATIFGLAALGPAMGSLEQLRVETREMTLRLLLAGGLFGFAGLLKPPLAGAGAVVAAALSLRVLQERGRSWASVKLALRPVAVILVGGAAPFALCLLWFWVKGALPDLYRVLFVFTPHYTTLSWEGRSALSLLYQGFTEWLSHYSSLTTVGLVLGLALPRAPRERFGLAVLLGIIGLQIVGVALQAKFFPYHWGATWPLTALIAALGYDRVWERAVGHGLSGVTAFFLGLAGAAGMHTAARDLDRSWIFRSRERIAIYSHSPRDLGLLDDLASLADVDAATNREVAQLVEARVPEGQPIFIWGFEPVVYDLAHRPPASRYIYDVPQRTSWGQAGERALLMRDLARTPPAAILVKHWDPLPKVTGNQSDSAGALRTFPALEELLSSRYQLASTVRAFDVYLPKS